MTTPTLELRRVTADAENPPLIVAQNVHRILGEGDAASLILKGVSLKINRREYVSIVGASGSGKSTLLYLLGGLDRPSVFYLDDKRIRIACDPPSRVFIDGQDTTLLGDPELAGLRNETIGFVVQVHYLLK